MNDSEYSGKLYYSKREKLLTNFSNVFLAICIIVCLVLTTFFTIFSSAEVFGLSMYPNINYQNKENVNYNDTAYYTNLFGYSRGDVVIVDLPTLNKDGIKRLIAVGEDVVSFGNINLSNEYYIYLNGARLIEPYLSDLKINITSVNNFKTMIKNCINGDESKLSQSWLSKNDEDEWQITLPHDYCIYLGDNRTVSNDCSIFGPQKTSTIEAKVFIVVPYGLNIYNYYFYKFCHLFY